MKSDQTESEPTRVQQIVLHARCPWRTWREARFHLVGILRAMGIAAY